MLGLIASLLVSLPAGCFTLKYLNSTNALTRRANLVVARNSMVITVFLLLLLSFVESLRAATLITVIFWIILFLLFTLRKANYNDGRVVTKGSLKITSAVAEPVIAETAKAVALYNTKNPMAAEAAEQIGRSVGKGISIATKDIAETSFDDTNSTSLIATAKDLGISTEGDIIQNILSEVPSSIIESLPSNLSDEEKAYRIAEILRGN